MLLLISTENIFADIIQSDSVVILEDHKESDEEYSNLVIGEELFASRGSATYSFSVSPSQPHYRIYVQNTSDSSINVSVGGNGFKVNYGEQVQNVYTASSYSTRYVDITSSDGSALQGTIAVRVSYTISEFN